MFYGAFFPTRLRRESFFYFFHTSVKSCTQFYCSVNISVDIVFAQYHLDFFIIDRAALELFFVIGNKVYITAFVYVILSDKQSYQNKPKNMLGFTVFTSIVT